MKVLKHRADSSDMVIVNEGYSQLTSKANSVTVTGESGTFINGPLSISSQIDNIKVGGIFKFNPLLASCLPSTMITPIPTLVMDIPVRNLKSASGIASILQGIL